MGGERPVWGGVAGKWVGGAAGRGMGESVGGGVPDLRWTDSRSFFDKNCSELVTISIKYFILRKKIFLIVEF